MTQSDTPSGMILFDKPQGWTSHDGAEAFRRMLGRGAKVGHCGALDPLATGLLILLVGRATRLQARMQGLGKLYSGLIRLGVTTDTGDITGKVLENRPVPPLTLAQVKAACDGFRGRIEMDAPAFSAVKHKGKALYRYARQGITVPAKPRVSTVYTWEAISLTPEGIVGHRIGCSSGTYVRSLAEALGRKLGCGATVESLRRERIADFDVKNAITLESSKTLNLGRLHELLTESFPILQEFVARPALSR